MLERVKIDRSNYRAAWKLTSPLSFCILHIPPAFLYEESLMGEVWDKSKQDVPDTHHFIEILRNLHVLIASLNENTFDVTEKIDKEVPIFLHLLHCFLQLQHLATRTLSVLQKLFLHGL